MRVNGRTLVRALLHPEILVDISPRNFSALARLAQRELLLARLGAEAEKSGILDNVHPIVREVLADAILAAQASQRRMRFEADRIRRALLEADTPIILLKGLAYLAVELEGVQGRFCSDVDILVPKVDLARVEAQLRDHGWKDVKRDAYDDSYYRQWMHELPPLRHEKRATLIDVHHAILPLTARLRPSSQALIDAAQPCPWPRYAVLAGDDMILHCAAHAFHDGDLSGGLRNLFDFKDLMASFASEKLLDRAVELELARPLGYALRYLRRICGIEDYRDLEQALRRYLPAAPILKIMDHLVENVLLNSDPWRVKGEGYAKFALYIRSHWLRMPPLMLARHLSTKAMMRRT